MVHHKNHVCWPWRHSSTTIVQAGNRSRWSAKETQHRWGEYIINFWCQFYVKICHFQAVANVGARVHDYGMVPWVQDSRCETIMEESMIPIMRKLLKFFAQNKGDLPEQIIVFRDGVSESQFSMVWFIVLKCYFLFICLQFFRSETKKRSPSRAPVSKWGRITCQRSPWLLYKSGTILAFSAKILSTVVRKMW